MSIKFSKNRKLPTFASYPNSVIMSLWGINNTKKLSPPGKATHHSINISYLDNFAEFI